VTHPCVDRPALSIGEIHVWTARLVDEHRAAADLLRILSREERAQAAQFAFERDRMRFIQAHGVVRQILSNYSDADAATLTFARNHHGKPYLIPRVNNPNLQFSVSRSGAVSEASCEEASFMAVMLMAWSPVRRFSVGRFEVDHPGDYATLIPTNPATAP
jgi:4'-phosphopantetheinyl transferase family protien